MRSRKRLTSRCMMAKTTVPQSTKRLTKPRLKPSGSAKSNRRMVNGAGVTSRSAQMLAAMLAFRDSDFSVRLPSDWDGIEGQLAVAFNQVISQEDRLSHEVERVSRSVGREGRLKQRM